MDVTGRSLVWIIDGALSLQMHKAARVCPAMVLSKLGWDVTMITSGVPSEDDNGTINFIELAWPKVYMLGPLIYHMAAVYQIMSGRIRCDVVMFQNEYAPLLLPVALWNKLANSNKTKVLMDTRSMPMVTETSRGRFRALFFKLGHWMASHLPVFQTAITKEMVETVGVPKTQLVGVWPSGVNVEEFASCPSMRNWSGPEDPVRLIYLGVVRPERNLTAVADAVRLARKDGVNVVFEVVGEGSCQRELEEYARSNGNGIIKVSRRVPRKDVPFVLSKADIGILPFPDLPKMRVSSFIKLFEYMAAGMPIVATRIVAHTEVLGNADFAFWADDATPEALAVAIKNACARKRDFPKLGSKAQSFAQNWTWEASGRKLSEALTKVLLS